MNKVLRCQIVKPVDMDWNVFGDIVRELQIEVRFIKNKTLSMYNDWINFSVVRSRVKIPAGNPTEATYMYV